MRLPMETDYAFRIMYTLALMGERCDTKVISEKCGISQQTVLKVIRRLMMSGLVTSKQGKSGGYELSKKAGDTTLLEVFEAMESKICFSKCLEEDYICSRMCDKKHECAFHRLFGKINGEIVGKLSGFTLEDMLSDKI